MASTCGAGDKSRCPDFFSQPLLPFHNNSIGNYLRDFVYLVPLALDTDYFPLADSGGVGDLSGGKKHDTGLNLTHNRLTETGL